MPRSRSSSSVPRTAWLGRGACALFVVTIGAWLLTSVVADAALGGLPLQAQRWIGVLTLVVPGVVGAALGLASLLRHERPRSWALAGVILNTLAALFFGVVLAWAG